MKDTAFKRIQYVSKSTVIAMEAEKLPKSSDGLYKLRGPAIFLDQVSKNNRQYDAGSVKECIDRLQPMIAKKALFGELEHPRTEDIYRIATIDYDNIAHRIDAIWYDKDTNAWWIEITILNNAKGQKIASVLNVDSPVFVSLRSLLDPDKTYDDAKGVTQAYMIALITIDVVLNPGFDGAEMSIVARGAEESHRMVSALESIGVHIQAPRTMLSSAENFDVDVQNPTEDTPGSADPVSNVGLQIHDKNIDAMPSAYIASYVLQLANQNGGKLSEQHLEQILSHINAKVEFDEIRNLLTFTTDTGTSQVPAVQRKRESGIVFEFSNVTSTAFEASPVTNKRNHSNKNKQTMARRNMTRSGRAMYAFANESETELADDNTQTVKSATATDFELPETLSKADVDKTIDYILDNLFKNNDSITDAERESVTDALRKIAIDIDGSMNKQEKALAAKTILDKISRLNDNSLTAYYHCIADVAEGKTISVESRATALSMLVRGADNVRGSRRSRRRAPYAIVANESETELADDNTQTVKSATATDFVMPETLSSDDIKYTINYLIDNILANATDAEHDSVMTAMCKTGASDDIKAYTDQERATLASIILSKVSNAFDASLTEYKKAIDTLSGYVAQEAYAIVEPYAVMESYAIVEPYAVVESVESDVTGKQIIESNVSDDAPELVATISDEDLDNVMSYLIDNELANATDAERDSVMKSMTKQGVTGDIKDYTRQQRAMLAVTILETVSNAFDASLTEYKKALDQLSSSSTALESVSALVNAYRNVSGMQTREFEGIYAVENIPNAYVHLFDGLSKNAKRYIASQAKAQRVTTASENIKFWSSVNFMNAEKAVIATETAIVQGLTETEQKALRDEKNLINFMRGAFIR